MKRKPSGNEIQSLLDAIKASDVVENRTQLISQLEEFDVTNENECASILECLTTFWEDFTCLDVSQCMLNKSILKVATTYLQADTSKCLHQLLALGTKATIWCRKHMKMTLMSTEDSQEEEHYALFFQVLLDMLSHSAAVLVALTRHPVSTEKELMFITETSILEVLNLTKDSILEAKRIHTFDSEVLKASQVVLDAVISLCKSYSNNLKLDSDDKTEKESDQMNHIINITKSIIQNLVDLGILAANAGGNLVTVLNISWKGVVTLLQLCKGTLADKMDISDIILSLLSLAKGSLSCAAKTWSSLMEPVSMTEAKRIFIPVKFYLINAARIISHYPSQAFLIFKDITLCIITILTFRIHLGKEDLLKSASEALSELIEPTSIHLLNSLLNSTQLEQEHKHQILDWLFTDIPFVQEDELPTLDAIFSLTFGSKRLLLGQVALFVNLLRSAADVENDVKLEIAKKLEWVLNIVIHEDVYSSILALPLPLSQNSGENMFCSIIHAMKTFMLVISSTSIWDSFESFLLENIFHPHHLCWEIVTQLWCFLVRHSETEMRNEIIYKFCMLLKSTASWESVLDHNSVVRKLSRSICRIVRHGSETMGDRVFNFIMNGDVSKLSCVMFTALLMEGFPLNCLSSKVRSVAKQGIVTDYFQFIDAFDDDECESGMFGAPVFALSAALLFMQVSISDTEMKTINLLISIINKFKNTTKNNSKKLYLHLLNETLFIISTMKHLYTSDHMETLILHLHSLFTSEDTSTLLSKCKPNLCGFISGLTHMEFDTNQKVSASSQLFHMLLKERHWGLCHLALTAFGYFSARTNCSELWRFVPHNASLSFDLEYGVDLNEELFMSEFTVFFEKQAAHLVNKPNHGKNEVALLVKEGVMLRKMVEEKIEKCDKMEIDEDDGENVKKRKVCEEVREGVAKLEDGLRVIGNGLMLLKQSQFDFSDFDADFMTHFSHIEDAVGCMAASIS